jgi:hypothetical protein
MVIFGNAQTAARTAALACMCFAAAGCEPARIAAPKEFVKYSASDKSFDCVYPKGWEVTSASSHGVEGGALFKTGLAKIDITSDLAGSLMGDIARSAGNIGSGLIPGVEPKRKPPVELLHQAGLKSATEANKNYQEQTARVLKSRLGEARISEFTSGGTLLIPKMHGYRVTILGMDRRVTVFCKCPEGDWAALKPAFDRVLKSLTAGTG